MIEVELIKGTNGFGFSIVGGTDSQHIPGDNGIYFSRITVGGVAEADGRIFVGDRLVAIKNLTEGNFVLDNCTHEEAANVLRKQCKEHAILVVSKTETSQPFSPAIFVSTPLGNFELILTPINKCLQS